MSAEMDEIWALFVDDGTQALDAMETALLELDPLSTDVAAQAPHIAALFRAVHTFKGNSRVLGLGVVESRAHLAEDLIGLVRDNGVPFDAEIHSLLLETGDRLRDMLDVTAASHADVDPAATQDLMARLSDKIARCAAPGDAPLHALLPGDAIPAPATAQAALPDAIPNPSDAMSEPTAAPDATFLADLSAVTDAGSTHEDRIDEGSAYEGSTDGASSTQSADPAPVAPTARLADDPAYRRIFDDMVADAHTRLQGSNDPATAARVAADLAHAATQLGLDEWSAMLARHRSVPDAATDAAILIADIDALCLAPSQPQPSQPQPATGFLCGLEHPLAIIARTGLGLTTGEQVDVPLLTQAAADVCAAAESEGYVRVAAAAAAIPQAPDAATFRRAELRLYEELAAVEDVLGQDAPSDGISPARLLANWCADHVFDTLDELDRTLERLRRGQDMDAGHRDLERLVRLVHHACRHYGLNMASQLAMSLLDLFGRGHAHGDAPDAILMRIARGFIDTLELVFDALREGEPPDTARLEQLFREASEMGFTGAGVMTATAIERKLGLPPEFHRVLSPDSTRRAAAALSAGSAFHILRADVNDDNTLAEALFDLIGSGAIDAITNVTVFEGQRTIFDFLIATTLDDLALTEALARLDPAGRRIVLLRHLTPHSDETTQIPDPTADITNDATPGLDLSADMLERIGEIAASQALVHGMLGELVENDLADAMDQVLRLHGQDPRQARLALRGLADGMMERLRNLAQLETQLLGHMTELQQNTAQLRARPVETVLRPLTAMLSAQARGRGMAVTITTSGAEIALDVSILDMLKRVLRPLILSRLSDAVTTDRRLHLMVNRSDDHVSITLEDNADHDPDPAQMQLVTADLARAGGHLRQVRLPGGGARLHLSLPMSLVVLEGMVVGAGGTRYVLPVDSIRTILQPDAAALIDVAAGGGQQMLRLSKDEVVLIRPLPAANATLCDHVDHPDHMNHADHVDHMDHMDHAGLPSSPATTMGPMADTVPAHGKVHVVLGRAGQSVAIPVDDLVGQQLVLLRPLRGLMSRLRNISGVALLSGGDVGMVLSPRALCEGAGNSALQHPM